MKVVMLGLSITSSWGNGHATTYRSLMRAKFGLGGESQEGDDALMGKLLSLMVAARADYTLTFRGLSRLDEAWFAGFGSHRAEAEAWAS